ncbi:helix-turn-helix domain-containing protein [Inquilinus limosus]|uniref:helix-turn-helix domain-containing protein n=1 Tax=Inquilinus limosus TaxID=171674 RepID=UPI0004201347|nr:helix-turn-helix transcriptional regulator [Inquilinus limosus]
MIAPEEIRTARRMLNWTQAELARRARLSVTGLHNIEAGVANPRASTLARISSALENGRAPESGRDGEAGDDAEMLLRSLRSDVALLYTVLNARLDQIERRLRGARPDVHDA